MRPSIHFAKKMHGRRQVRGVEVGVEAGYNALNMLQEWPEIHELVLVEIDETRRDEISRRLHEYGPRYRLMIGPARGGETERAVRAAHDREFARFAGPTQRDPASP